MYSKTQQDNGFLCYQVYCAVKAHFNSESYDYFKYGGHIKIAESTYKKRRDKNAFIRLAKKFQKVASLEEFLFANFIDNDGKLIFEMLTDEAQRVNLDWQRRKGSRFYIFTQECQKIHQLTGGDFMSAIRVNKTQTHPFLLTLMLRGEIGYDTVVILDQILSFLSIWKKEISDRIIYPKYSLKLEKVRSVVMNDAPNLSRYEQLVRSFVAEAVHCSM